jgi:hypothetical protein
MEKPTMQNRTQNTNGNSEGRDNWHFIVMAIIEAAIIAVNFIGLLFAALQVKSEKLWLQIIPGLFIILQVPLLPFLFGFSLYSIGFLFIHRNVDPKKGMKDIRMLINIHVMYVLYFIAMFAYWGITAMSLPQPK